MASTGFRLNLPPQGKSTLEFMKIIETEKGFLRLVQFFMVTSLPAQRFFRWSEICG
jgi:hypothetical protein